MSRFDKYHQRKTDRQYGATWRMILDRAKQGPFAVSDLSLGRKQAYNNVFQLVLHGRLKVIEPGTMGRRARPAKYGLA